MLRQLVEVLRYIPKLSKIGFAIMHKIETSNKKNYEIIKNSREKMNVTFTPVGKHRTKCIMKNEQLQMLVNGKLGCLKKGTIPMPTPWKLNIVKHGTKNFIFRFILT